MATSTTAETAMAALSWNGLNGITPTARGLLLNPNRGIGFVVQTTHAKEFALAHWLVGGADGGRLCLRCFDGAGIVRENIAGDALAPGSVLLRRLHHYLPGALEADIEAFVEHYNHQRYHESLNNLTPADVYFGRGQTILLERELIKRKTIQHRRLMHHQNAA